MISVFKKRDSQEDPRGSNLPYYARYITTTEFARVCNVTRLTVINWVNKKKIRSVQTMGGHRRIPLMELLSFLESTMTGMRNAKKSRYCWEHAKKLGKEKKCKTCALRGSPFHYCSVVAANLGKESIHCSGNCSTCDYLKVFLNHEWDCGWGNMDKPARQKICQKVC
ncbi:MAG: excisionase family DNA-binding protein [Candidatus Omnitrophota bacterium]